MKRLFVIANQLPIEIRKIKNKFHIQAGGEREKSGLTDFYDGFDTRWIGLTGIENYSFSTTEKEQLDKQLQKEYRCIPVFPDQHDLDNYLHGFVKSTLWPLFHYFTQNVSYTDEQWTAYQKINQLIAEKVTEVIQDGDIVWIHDYHLTLLPRLIRSQKQEVSIGLFVHIPFPSFEIFRLLPWRTEILEGILCADLVGFHTYDYVRHFLSCVRRILGHDTIFNQIRIGDRTMKVDAFPRGIDYKKFHTEAVKIRNGSNKERSLIGKELERQLKQNGDKKLIFSEGELDYAKGLINRLQAFELFLQKKPQYLEKVLFILIATPTGETGEIYNELKRNVDELVGRINGNYGTINWMPIWYLNREFTLDELNDLYALTDIALILPIREGMNLIAKRFIASRADGTGVLILSEMAGAAKELHESLITNPNNLNEVVDALTAALEMPEDEQVSRNQVMQKRLERYNVDRWAREFIKGLESVKELQETILTRKITDSGIDQIAKTFKNANKRILFLDYDGTLTWFKKNPEDARPDEELYHILEQLSSENKNRLIIISGRDKETLTRWFDQGWNIHFIAEHGVWIRDPKTDWHMMEQINNDWMESVRPLLEFYVDQTPRSFIEEKNFSLVWHYRKADPDLGIQRAWELKDALHILTSNLNLEIMDGDKVLEIKYSGVNKGRAAGQKLVEDNYDFIFAIGDDWTDEFTFDAMPEKAYTIKVGAKTTKARYYIESVEKVRELLNKFIG